MTTNRKKKRRPSLSHAFLKATLVLGTVLATWFGTNWVAQNDKQQAAEAAAIAQQLEAQAQQQSLNQPVTSSRSSR